MFTLSPKQSGVSALLLIVRLHSIAIYTLSVLVGAHTYQSWNGPSNAVADPGGEGCVQGAIPFSKAYELHCWCVFLWYYCSGLPYQFGDHRVQR